MMPRKTRKPRKAGEPPVSVTRTRRAMRPDLKNAARTRVPEMQSRRKRLSLRPPRFPGRLGGR